MIILGIESSCDDTSVALLDCNDSGFIVLSEKTASQIDVHKKYGGVVPEIAGRMHAENILPVVEEVMGEWKRETENEKPDVIAATTGPGLITGLLVGTEVAKTLSYLWDVPIIGVNHIEGHIHSVLVRSSKQNQSLITNLQFPALCLIVSGGHTELILMEDFGKYTLLGNTRDDAAGEAFDKVGKLLGFEYPGGPKISKLAVTGKVDAIPFPRPMIKDDNYSFSFAGLKTSALYKMHDNPIETEEQRVNFCASFEQAIVDVLVTKTKRAAKQYNPKTIILGGGVSANKKLRKSLETMTEALPDSKLLVPTSEYTMDNGAMIAAAAYHRAKKKEFVNWKDVQVNPNWHVYDK
jgi:N6-L-threonylcarbamoyladenine synthase